MPAFRYRARDHRGKLLSGIVDAKDEHEVANLLMEKELVPINISLAQGHFSLSKLLRLEITSSKVKTDDLIMLCRQMYTMTKAGVPLLGALEKLAEVTRNPLLKRTMLEVAAQIEKGSTFAVSLKQFPTVFPSVFISVVNAGERSGELEEAFLRLAHYFELDAKTKKRIKAATRYPVMVVGAILIALGVMNFMVIPAFAQMFASFKVELPLVTRILMGSSNFMIHNWLWLVLIIAALVLLLRYQLRTPAGRYQWDKMKLKLPVIGGILHRITLARFSRIFTMTTRSGVPMVEGIQLVANAVGNAYIAKAINQMEQGISRGEPLHHVAEHSGVFSSIVLQMLAVGENTGAIDIMLEEVADFYEREVDYDLARLGDMIEPILLVVMGCLVLLLALGVFLPMWDMTSFIKR